MWYHYVVGKATKEVIEIKERVHPPYNKLKGILREKELTYADIAEDIGTTETTISQKINGYSDFFMSEVTEICRKRGLSTDFFA